MILKLNWSQNGTNTELIIKRDWHDMLEEQLVSFIIRAFVSLNYNLVFERATQKLISANKNSYAYGTAQIKV